MWNCHLRKRLLSGDLFTSKNAAVFTGYALVDNLLDSLTHDLSTTQGFSKTQSDTFDISYSVGRFLTLQELDFLGKNIVENAALLAFSLLK